MTGIARPKGFRAVSQVYRFGPSGTKFASGKELILRIKLEEKSQQAQLYYINRDNQRLEEVRDQVFDQKAGKLVVKIGHFSDYVLGVSADWDGWGVNPFFDIIQGEESVHPSTLGLTVRSNVLSLPGRGFNLQLTRVMKPRDAEAEDILSISEHWSWDLPYVSTGGTGNGGMVNIPGKGTFALGNYKADCPYINKGEYSYRNTGNTYTIYKCSGAGSYYLIGESYDEDDRGVYPILYLKDGTRVVHQSRYILVTDPNGNWYKYTYTIVDDSGSTWIYRLGTLTDSMGHSFSFSYHDDLNFSLDKIVQNLSNGQKRTVLSHSIQGRTEYFTDALGRTTTYYWNSNGTLVKVVYPNNARTEYGYSNNSYRRFAPIFSEEEELVVASQQFFEPNQTKAAKKISYQTTNLGSGNYQITVDDGLKIKKYTCKVDKWNTPPYITKESTYSQTGQMVSEKKFTYYTECKLKIKDMLKSVTNTFATGTGELGQEGTYQYEYDEWGNTTRIIDPEGTETRLAYANTISVKKLSTYNQQYQDSRYENDFILGWNRPVTKATLITDPVHGTNQLKQTHYQYDSKGNQIQKSEVYENSILNSLYTYDSYGNILIKTDANGKQTGL